MTQSTTHKALEDACRAAEKMAHVSTPVWKLISALVTAIEQEKPHSVLRRIIREHAPMLHCNPPFESMSPESKGALTSIVAAALDQFKKPDNDFRALRTPGTVEVCELCHRTLAEAKELCGHQYACGINRYQDCPITRQQG